MMRMVRSVRPGLRQHRTQVDRPMSLICALCLLCRRSIRALLARPDHTMCFATTILGCWWCARNGLARRYLAYGIMVGEKRAPSSRAMSTSGLLSSLHMITHLYYMQYRRHDRQPVRLQPFEVREPRLRCTRSDNTGAPAGSPAYTHTHPRAPGPGANRRCAFPSNNAPG